MEKKRLVSGTRPTGLLHLGHLEGMLKNCVRLQDEYECFPFVADWHALTDHLDTTQLREFTLQVAIDWLSAGIDPEKSTFFIQSHVPEHAELEVLLSMLTPVPWLERCPTYKDHIQSLDQKQRHRSIQYVIHHYLLGLFPARWQNPIFGILRFHRYMIPDYV